MNRFHFSIRSFLAVITLLALGLGAMASQSELAASCALTVFLSLVGLATAVAFVRRAPNRAFWIGFAVFGWMYWWVEFTLPGSAATPAWTTGSLGTSSQLGSPPGPGLITGRFIRFVEANVTPNRQPGSPVMARWTNNGRYYPATIVQESHGQIQVKWVDGGTFQWTPANLITANAPQLVVAGHALMGSLFGLVGGILATVVAGWRKSSRHTPCAVTSTIP
jgi:hypothetical protein